MLPPMDLDDELRAELEALRDAGLLREPPTLTRLSDGRFALGDRPLLVFCSNDYLGLADDPALIEAARDALGEHGLGGGASRLVSGTRTAHRDAERALAAWVGADAALLFSSGYAANVGALSTLLRKGDVAFSDRLNHASLIDGLRASRAKVHIYGHGDVDHLEWLLRRHRPEGDRAFVVSDTLFSMDGDVAPVEALRERADAHDAALYVDEAHTLGVIGAGEGLCRELGVRPDVVVGTLGKATGLSGAFVAGSAPLRALLENRARSFVFSTAIPPFLAAVITASVQRVRHAADARARLAQHATRIRSHLRARGWNVPEGESPIIPVHVGDSAETMRLSAALLDRGVFVQGIRPPTVPQGTSRLRIVPTAAHRAADIDALLEAFDGLHVT